VVASAGEDELHRLAGVVDARLSELTGQGRAVAPQALLLAALSLAHDLEVERAARASLELRSREMLRTVLERIDAALEELPDEAATRPAEASPES
jgi:cell division protein ZapA